MTILANDVHYFVESKGEGKPLLLLHGFTGDHSTWNVLSKQLSPSYQVITMDLLGHGRTDAPLEPERYQIEKAAEDIVTILDYLGIEKVSLLGYSLGGRLALSLAMLFPERVDCLLLESSSPGLKTEQERAERKDKDEKLAKFIIQQGIEQFVNYWETIPLFATQKNLPQSIRQQIRDQRLANSPLGLANSLRGMGTGSQPSWWDQLSHLHLPVALFCGEYDKKFCKIAEQMKQLLPDPQFVCVPHVGHAIHVEDPEKFVTIVKEFLTKNFARKRNNLSSN